MNIAHAQLASTGDYQQDLEINSIPTFPQHVELKFTSVLLTAKDPGDRQVRHRVVVERSRLPAIIRALEQAS